MSATFLRVRGRAGLVLVAALLAAMPARAADALNGARLYGLHCAGCHGAQGAPLLPGTPDFRRIESLLRPDAQLLRSIRSGQRAMPAFLGILRDAEILDVIAHLRTFH
ncbi:MAG: hypothetical protein RJA44_2693 [Pseudomonadota bacterium]|jgi:mono/diheme cytochrome c family protein